MSRKIFVNLPVSELERSVRFYEAIGARKEPKFSNDVAAMMVLSETISVMLLSHDFYRTFTSKEIADAHGTSQVILCISCDSPEEVDSLVAAASGAGGIADPGQKQEVSGMMYGRSFEDPDGHHWEPSWMDAAGADQGASALEASDAAEDTH